LRKAWAVMLVTQWMREQLWLQPGMCRCGAALFFSMRREGSSGGGKKDDG